MATQTVRPLEVAYEPLYQWDGLEAAASTFKLGAVLVYDSSGRLTEASNNSGVPVVGIATKAGSNTAASGTTYGTCTFVPFLSGTIIEGNLVYGAAGSATLITASHVGLKVGIVKRTAEADTPWAFDLSDVARASAHFLIIGVRDASADVNARVWAICLASHARFSA